jgi:nitrite reductase/ring-hydroxylating ferredoxin subunit
VVGGEDHKSGEASEFDERFARLEAWARVHFSGAGQVEHRWSGQVMEPVDYAPYIGRNHGNQNVFICTGDSGEGLTTGVAASLILRDFVLGRENPWSAAYEPQRVTLRAATEYLSENLTMAANLAEHLTGGDISSLDELKPGQGAVIRSGTKKIAAYRDEQGQLHLRSAVCTHANCVVHWNALEGCWDCPCHGSHFSVDDEPINGPAIYPLAEASV